MTLVNCSCGTGWVDGQLDRSSALLMVKLSVPPMVAHWRQGHAITTPSETIHLAIAACATEYAQTAPVVVEYIPPGAKDAPKPQQGHAPWPAASGDEVREAMEDMWRRARGRRGFYGGSF